MKIQLKKWDLGSDFKEVTNSKDNFASQEDALCHKDDKTPFSFSQTAAEMKKRG